MPENGVSGGRYVGDINEFRCGIGYVGNDSATCLPSGKWNKQINSKCERMYWTLSGAIDVNLCAVKSVKDCM